ncbi:MAG TPA: 2-isopropylmalate synthase, partial [Thermoanaerobaculia bacterium]|nr:2-isopropylmalate synthase [Thermoanaerobaculia bacterium]
MSAPAPDRVVIFDTTLRDGEQAPGFSLRHDQKLRFARTLDELGVDVIEAGFPIASTDDFEAVRDIAREVRRPAVAALARCMPADIDRAGQALSGAARPRMHVFVASSDLHLARKLGMTREQALEAAVTGVERARRYADDIEFSAEDATRSDPAFLATLIAAVAGAGATTVNLPDTVGYSVPEEIREMFRTVRSQLPPGREVIFSAHCHNDLGLAVANSLAAIEGGARQIECTVNGIGERAGNASVEELVMALKVRGDRLPFTTGVRTPVLYAASQLLTELTGETVQANKAIVGRNAFAHEAGIHQDGLLKDRRTYEIMRAEDVGRPAATLVLGKHSGRHALKVRCEALQIALSRLELDDLYRAMVRRAEVRKVVEDRDLKEMVEELRG